MLKVKTLVSVAIITMSALIIPNVYARNGDIKPATGTSEKPDSKSCNGITYGCCNTTGTSSGLGWISGSCGRGGASTACDIPTPSCYYSSTSSTTGIWTTNCDSKIAGNC